MIKKSHLLRLFTVLLTASPCSAFISQQAVQHASIIQQPKSISSTISRRGHCVQLSKRPYAIPIPGIIYKLNSSTKWLVTAASIVAVWSRPHQFFGPFIVVGSIAAVYLTVVLKGVINQGRPEGAPFADPGMPSSHSLVSFFLAVAWKSLVGCDGILVAAAAAVATLRVVCGYHTIPQIAVGAVLGSGMGYGWFALGKIFHASNPKLAFALAWSAYLGLSAIYIQRDMRKWLTEHKHL
jgi:membrane-associated phospholipid phosphatase